MEKEIEMLYLKVLDAKCQTVAMAKGENEVNLVCERIYQAGDHILLESDEKDIFLWLQFDVRKICSCIKHYSVNFYYSAKLQSNTCILTIYGLFKRKCQLSNTV